MRVTFILSYLILVPLVYIDAFDSLSHEYERTLKSLKKKKLKKTKSNKKLKSIKSKESSKAHNEGIVPIQIDPRKPLRSESSLSYDDYSAVEQAHYAMERIIADVNRIISGINGQNITAANVMVVFDSVARTVGSIVSEFAATGKVLHLFLNNFSGQSMVTRVPPFDFDPMIDYMDSKFRDLNSKLDDLLGDIGEIPTMICKSAFDEKRTKHIGDFGGLLDRVRNSKNTGRQEDYELLKKNCKTSLRPDLLIRYYQDVLFRKQDLLKCYNQMTNDVSDRVGYLRMNWAAPLLANMMTAIEYQGLCNGILEREGEVEVEEVIPGSRCEKTSVECEFDNVHKVFKDEETRMYNLSPGAWLGKFDDYNFENEQAVYKALKSDFFPDFKYAIVQYSETGGNVDKSQFAGYKKSYGATIKGKFFVFHQHRDYKRSIGRIEPKWKNVVCTGESMCTYKYEKCGFWPWDPCEHVCGRASHCHSMWHMKHQHIQKSNPVLWNTLNERGAWLIRSGQRHYNCWQYACFEFCEPGICCKQECIDGPSWRYRSSRMFLTECHGDNICEKFTKSMAGDEDNRDTQVWVVLGVSF